MKRLLVILFVFISIYVSGQQIPLQVQAKRGVFTERLNLNGLWIDRISTDLNSPDSNSGNVLATGKAIADYLRPRTNRYIQNQFAAPQPASLWLQGNAAVGPVNNYMTPLTSGMPAQVYIAHRSAQHGLSVQRSTNDQSPASLVFFKNNAPDFNTPGALQPGDKMGSLIYSAHARNATDVVNICDIQGLVEKTAPAYLSSGFVFSTIDTGGTYGQRMWLNAAGNLLLGNGTTNPYKLNVANGDVRFKNLGGQEDVLVGANGDGVLSRLYLGGALRIEDGYLNAYVQEPEGRRIYTAVLSQTGTQDPVVHVLENPRNVEITWTRTAPGVYTGVVTAGGGLGQNQVFHAEPSDEAGNVFSASLAISRPSDPEEVYTLRVKDNNLAGKDGWTNISIQIRGFLFN